MKKQKNKKIFLVAVLMLSIVIGAAALLYPFCLKLYRKMAKLPDENGMYQIENHWFQELKVPENQTPEKFAQKLLSIQETYLTPNNKVFVSIIPDKSWYVKDSGYPIFNHESFEKKVIEHLPNFSVISLIDSLSLNSYYLADRHWKQESLQSVLNTLGKNMGFSIDLSEFTVNEFSPFYGDFSKYIKNPPAETLIYLTNSATDSTWVDNYQAKDTHTVYDIEKLQSNLPYDVFLSGITPVLHLNNPEALSEKELVIFRDSYASSLAPLLCREYKKITLIDLRFMHSSLIPEHITFSNQDVLFLYSDWIASNSSLLR